MLHLKKKGGRWEESEALFKKKKYIAMIQKWEVRVEIK